jgi:hypothetical protein
MSFQFRHTHTKKKKKKESLGMKNELYANFRDANNILAQKKKKKKITTTIYHAKLQHVIVNNKSAPIATKNKNKNSAICFCFQQIKNMKTNIIYSIKFSKTLKH